MYTIYDTGSCIKNGGSNGDDGARIERVKRSVERPNTLLST